MAFTTYTTTNGSITLTGGNLIATSSSGTGSAASADFLRSGKIYFEFTYNVRANANTLAGLAISGATYSTTAANIVGVFATTGNIWMSGAATGRTLGALVNGDVIGVAVDLDTGCIWFRKGAAGNWNGVAAVRPDYVATGIALSDNLRICSPYAQFGATSEQITLNAGATAFTGAVPAGYTSGWTSPGVGTIAVAELAALDVVMAGTPAAQVDLSVLDVVMAGTPAAQVDLVSIEVIASKENFTPATRGSALLLGF